MLKSECLDRMIFFSEQSLRRAVAEFIHHYHGERMCPEVRGKRTATLHSAIRVSYQAATSACSRTSLRRLVAVDAS